jgi:anti-sigma factor (TIGR02949 family)
MTDEPRPIDCEEALERLYDYLDGELTAARSEQVRRHLERCAPCLKLSKFESAYVRFLEARARTRSAPDHLRRRILERLLFEGGGAEAP